MGGGEGILPVGKGRGIEDPKQKKIMQQLGVLSELISYRATRSVVVCRRTFLSQLFLSEFSIRVMNVIVSCEIALKRPKLFPTIMQKAGPIQLHFSFVRK
jgi:hypothetical protein